MAHKRAESSSAQKVLRIFRLLLSNDRRFFLSELANRVQCSEQTVLRLMSAIEREVGETLECGKENRRRWYRLKPSRSAARLISDDRQLRYLEICRDLAAPFLPEQIVQSLNQEIFRYSLAAADINASSGERSSFAFFSKGYIDYTPHFAKLELLRAAAQESRAVKLSYRAAGAQALKLHYFLPHRFACMSGTLYVLGADLTPDLQQLRFPSFYPLHRIAEVLPTGVQVDFKLDEADAQSFGLPWHEPRTFAVRFAPGAPAEYVRERIWARRQRLTSLPDGSLRLEITTCSEPEMEAWVRSFGKAAVLEGRVPDLPEEQSSSDEAGQR